MYQFVHLTIICMDNFASKTGFTVSETITIEWECINF